MRKAGKRSILGVLIDVVDMNEAAEAVIQAARDKRPMSISALAVHGLMTGVVDREQKFRLNQFDLLVLDGQPVRWALNWLHRAGLSERVYGPRLTTRLCERAAADGLPVYFYGSTADVLQSLTSNLATQFPRLMIAGAEPSKFRQLSQIEKQDIAHRIAESGAAIVFVGLGCPRQEVFVYEFRDLLDMPVLAVGAAFPFIAGTVPQAPDWMQDAGLEWLFRFCAEPRRLWRRYLFLNPSYLFLIALQRLRLSQFSTKGERPRRELLFG